MGIIHGKLDKTYPLVTEHLEYLKLIYEDKITVWLPKNINITSSFKLGLKSLYE